MGIKITRVEGPGVEGTGMERNREDRDKGIKSRKRIKEREWRRVGRRVETGKEYKMTIFGEVGKGERV